jgi:hypothetical protein
MRFKYRVKTYGDEEGEYSEYALGDKDSIIGIIESHWADEQSSSDIEIISIINKAGQSLLFEHQGKGVFDVYYLPLETSFHYHKKSRIEVVYHSLDLYAMNEINALEAFLNKRTKENKYIRGPFFYIDHDYRLNDKRSFRELIWIFWYGLPMGFIFTVLGLALLMLPILFLPIPLFLICLGTYFWLPGVMLHQQYLRDAHDLLVSVTKGSKTIRIENSYKKRLLNKSQIVTVTKFQNPAYKIPWSDYGYTEIVFDTGDIVNLSNLLVDQLFVLEKFSQDNIETKTINKMIPKLRNKSTVK